MLQRARFGLRSCDDVVQVNVSNIAHRGIEMDSEESEPATKPAF